MNYYDFQVVFQEIPGEISLCFYITGCPLRCKGCHSPFLWKAGTGKKLTLNRFEILLKKYSTLATCIVFMGGEWHNKELIERLKKAKSYQYKTCLYTGEDDVSAEIKDQLTWLKTGKWISSLGGLESSTTNQKFIAVKTNTLQNHLFTKTIIS